MKRPESRLEGRLRDLLAPHHIGPADVLPASGRNGIYRLLSAAVAGCANLYKIRVGSGVSGTPGRISKSDKLPGVGSKVIIVGAGSVKDPAHCEYVCVGRRKSAPCITLLPGKA